jgi:hypothetical protein
VAIPPFENCGGGRVSTPPVVYIPPVFCQQESGFRMAAGYPQDLY